MTSIDVPANKDSGKYKIQYQNFVGASKSGVKCEMEVDFIIGSDGANSRVAKVNICPRSGLSNLLIS